VALLGPIGALAARQVRIALAAAFGPALVCLLVVVLSSQTAWGGQRVTDGGDMSNSAALLLSIPLFVVVGAAGLALGRGLQVASAHRQSAPGQD
jgi:hypothetical protein